MNCLGWHKLFRVVFSTTRNTYNRQSMQFLNPICLLALPLIALPIIIHLLNQRRHRTIEWGAMQFLLSAKRMNRGMARLRQLLIMGARMLVIAGLIFAISRPLSSGWLGSLTGGRPETVIVLLDQSASMQIQQIETGETKLSSGVAKIAEALQTLVGDKPLVLINSSSNAALSVDRPQALLDLPGTSVTESESDIAAMLQTTLNYISDNQTGRTDVWICSDGAKNDWNPESSLWKALTSGFSRLEGVRIHLLNYSEPPSGNFSITVDHFERASANNQSELVIDFTVRRESDDESTVSLPLTFNINGIRSVMSLEIEGETSSLIGHRIPIDTELKMGWGQIELPTDSNASDNSYYFAFADPVIRQTAIVSESPAITRAIELAAQTDVLNGIEFQANRFTPEQVGEIDWQQTALLIWQAPLPSETEARQITSFIESGRNVIFLPPIESDETTYAGVSWGAWKRVIGDGQTVGFWNNDEDLLRKTRDGSALPVNDLMVYRHCFLNGDMRVLAKLGNEAPLLTRRTSNAGAMYFLTTLPTATHSSLDREGITLFAMIHRAIASGAESLGAAKQFPAGTLPAQAVAALPLLTPAAEDFPLASARPFRAGVYGNESQLIALNRPPAEDRFSAMVDSEIETIFEGLDYHVIVDQVGNRQSLASEIWRFFLALMGIALLAEAVLCMPPKILPKTESLSAGADGRMVA